MILPHLGPGGTQKVAAHVASAWADEGHDVTVVTLWTRPDDHRLGPKVKRRHLAFETIVARANRSAALKHASGLLKGLAYAQACIGSRAWLGRRSTGRAGDDYASARVLVKAHFDDVTEWSDFSAGLRLIRSGRLLSSRRVEVPRDERLLRHTGRVMVARLRETFAELSPGLVASMLSKTNIVSLLAARQLSIPVIVSERNDIDRQALEPPWDAIREKIYSQALMVTANSKGTIEQLSRFVPAEKLLLLPNPLVLPDIPERRARENRFVVAARLQPQKAIDIIIEAFGRVAPQLAGWQLHILGDGPEGERLRALAASLGLGQRVIFHGHVDNPEDHFMQAAVFVLASRYEGVPNAMLEAMACGSPAIVSDASPGPLEFAIDGETAMVFAVDDVGQLATAMARMASDTDAARRMGDAARRKMEEYVRERGMTAWNSLLEMDRAPVGRAPSKPEIA